MMYLLPIQWLDHLYEGVVVPECWQTFLAELSEGLGVRHSGLVIYKPGVFSLELRHGTPQTVLDQYRENYHVDDIWRLSAERLGLMKTGAILDTRDFVKTTDLHATGFYRDILKAIDVEYSTLVIANGVDDPLRPLIVLALMHGSNENLSAENKKMLTLLQAHLRRAALMRFVVEFRFMQDVVKDHHRGLCGQILLTAQGAIVLANSLAQSVLHDPAWNCKTGELHLTDSKEDKQLQVALQKIVSAKSRDENLHVRHSNGKKIMLHISLHDWQHPHASFISVLLVEADKSEGEVHAAWLVSLQNDYGLSAREQKIVSRLCAGMNLKQIGEEFGTSFHTVRAQLRSIFAKTGVNNQRELILMLK